MKKNIIYIILALSITSAYLFAGSIALSELPRNAVAFAEKYFPDNYLYRAMEMGGSYTLIFKGGLKIFVDSKGEWNTISGSGSAISIDYLEDKIKNTVKKEFDDKRIVYVQKRKKDYKFELMNGKKFYIDFEGNVIKR